MHLPTTLGARVSVAMALLSLGGAAHAQTAAEAMNTRALAATCANCHGTDGKAIAGEAMPALAGLSASHIVTQMKAFRDGTRPATVMHQITKGYTDEQIATLAAYFAARK